MISKLSSLRNLFILGVTSLLIAANPHSAISESFEKPPTLSAKSVLPQAMMKSSICKIDDQVTNDGYLNHYTLRSKYGTYTPRGTYFLMKTIREVEALQFIEKNFPSDKVATQAVGDAAKGIVTAPIKATKKVIDTVSDSEKLKKTAKAIPGGIKNLFGIAADAVSDLGNFAADAGRSAFKGESSGDGDHFNKATDFITEAALDFIGYNKAYREMAKTLGVDPYTQNETLRSELKRIASIQSATQVGAKFAPGYSIPGVNAANKYLDYAEKAATYEDPKEVEKLNSKIIQALKKNDSSNTFDRFSQEFQKNSSYTPVMHNAILKSVQTLADSNVKNFAYLLKAAANAKSRETAQFYVFAIDKLSSLHTGGRTLQSVIADVILPAAITKDGALILPLPVDYLVWTKEVSTILKGFKSKLTSQYNIKKAEVLIQGDMTPKCEQEILQLGASTVVKYQAFE